MRIECEKDAKRRERNRQSTENTRRLSAFAGDHPLSLGAYNNPALVYFTTTNLTYI